MVSDLHVIVIVSPIPAIPSPLTSEVKATDGFVIADEKMVEEDGIYYEIIKFIRSDVAFYSEKDIEFGPILRMEKSSLFKQKYEARIAEINYLLNNKSLPENKVNVLNNEKDRILNIIQ